MFRIHPGLAAILFLSALLLSVPGKLLAKNIIVGDFSHGQLDGWNRHTFSGETRYVLVKDAEQGTVCLAESRNSASGMVRKITIDLKRTPWMHWRWRVDHPLKPADETSRDGDDFPARIYVVRSGGIFFWRTLALNYVWSSHKPVGSHWASPYTANSRLLAVDSGSLHAGEWREHSRNVRDDFRITFGKKVNRIDAVAIMTDTDNTGGHARAWYGDIFFSDRP